MKIVWSVLLLALPFAGQAQKVMKCISGDCNRGEGEALIKAGVYYKGTFKKGEPDGQGHHTCWSWSYTGSFRAGWKDGYGVEFQPKEAADGLFVADSSKPVLIGTWSTGTFSTGIHIDPDGTETYATPNGFVHGQRPADAWINAQADGYQAALAKRGVVRKPAVTAVFKREGYQCISGDCQNGTGTAVKYQSDEQMDKYYSGRFENGQLVDGTMIDYSWAYVGQLSYGRYNGYGARFEVKPQGKDYVIDSSRYATFAKWKDNDMLKAAGISSTGERSWSANGKETTQTKLNDDWIRRQSDAYYELRKGKFLVPEKPTREELMLSKKVVNVGRNTWAMVLEWECLPDRSYFITAGSHKDRLPFAGVVMAQISGEDKLVVAEGEIARANPGSSWESMNAWKPAKAGHYTFLVRFYQDEIVGGRKEDYVSGVQLDCELHSSRKL